MVSEMAVPLYNPLSNGGGGGVVSSILHILINTLIFANLRGTSVLLLVAGGKG